MEGVSELRALDATAYGQSTCLCWSGKGALGLRDKGDGRVTQTEPTVPAIASREPALLHI